MNIGKEKLWNRAYRMPTIPDPSYQFKRNGSSSVDYLECSCCVNPSTISTIVTLKLRQLCIKPIWIRCKTITLTVSLGETKGRIGSFFIASADRTRILQDVEDIFTTTGTLSGLGKTSPGTYRNRRATTGVGGYVGTNIGDVNIAFANEKGLVVAEMFNGIMWGGIYLDKILNVHLNDSLYNDARLRREHENTSLLPGRNYTELEHHWDLAYGYYQYWLPFIQTSGLAVLRESRIKNIQRFRPLDDSLSLSLDTKRCKNTCDLLEQSYLKWLQ